MGIVNLADRLYNIVNLASSTPDAYVWDEPKSGAELYKDGFYVAFDGSKYGEADKPATEWTDGGKVVQFLKVRDVTGEVPPVAPDGLTITDPSEDSVTVESGTTSYDVVGMAGDDIAPRPSGPTPCPSSSAPT